MLFLSDYQDKKNPVNLHFSWNISEYRIVFCLCITFNILFKISFFHVIEKDNYRECKPSLHIKQIRIKKTYQISKFINNVRQ